ncbi:hypothetical protein L2U69_16600 [Zavarzinia compransoris]|uniref:hypothetical protein n=1 Tax=Zavarzinia marina TaxID=2911065 RepID=UPI001F3300F0|nr:hypothetical protein [Zavarzinia marina]MCF4167270.1 hypothetical protein [Zavarzinia marina]
MTPLPAAESREKLRRRKILSALFSVLFLLVPTAISAFYVYLFASPVYQVDTVFQVKTSYDGGGGGGKGALGFLKGGSVMGRAMDESFSVVRYIESRNALAQLQADMDLRSAFSKDSIDSFSRLSADADDEAFYSYFGGIVSIYFDEVSGMIVLETRAFEPDLAFRMATSLASQAESLINDFNARSEHDLTELARNELKGAEQRLRDAELALTKFRNEHGAIDPAATSSSVNGIIASLKAQAASIEAEILAIRDISRGEVPRLAELRNKLAGIQEQIKIEEARLTGSDSAWAGTLEQYGILLLQSDIAKQSYAASQSALDSAMVEARRQKLYVVDVVSPFLPTEPRLPHKAQTVFFTFLGALVALVIGRLVWAGVRDHMV